MRRRYCRKANTKQPSEDGHFFKSKIQTKLKVGKPNDKYEVEADRMADHVVNKTGQGDAVQKTEYKRRDTAKTFSNTILLPSYKKWIL